MTETLLVLGLPLAGTLILALWGHRAWAGEANGAVSLLTFLAALALTARVLAHGPFSVLGEQFFLDAFNVVLVTLTALVAFTTALFSRVYMRVEVQRGKLSPAQAALRHHAAKLGHTVHIVRSLVEFQKLL